VEKVKKIMVVLDGTAGSLTAAKYGIYLSRLTGASLIGIYVINEKVLSDLLKKRILIEEEMIDFENEMKKDAEKYLKQLEEMAGQKGIEVKKIIKRGVVHQEVLNTAKEEEVDMIVVKELRRMISIREASYDEMEQIFRHSDIPVIICKNKEKIERLYNSM